MTGVLEASHASAASLVPVTDAGGRVVDFLIAATNRHTKDVTGRGADQLRGRRLVETSPGVVKSGVLDDYLSVYESGAPLTRGPLEFVEARDGLLWPASLMVRAVRAGDRARPPGRRHLRRRVRHRAAGAVAPSQVLR
ncbi:hypothetical protein [Nonomuraea dietziae]|uniref:hypothetical protein n=1 Tax=Nonomuraea dietziae TaxID=65515 RepID=UPI00343FEE3D